MKITFFGAILLFISFPLIAQVSELNYPEATHVPSKINASWVTHPQLGGGEHAVVYFRNEFEIDSLSKDFIVNISADNHYRLYVNGQWLVEGPQHSDILHWKYETLNLAPYLKTGKNVIAIEVYNWGYLRHFGTQSVYTALFVNAISDNANFLNTTGPSDSWKCYWNRNYHANEVKWRIPPRDIIGGLYANNPTDSLILTEPLNAWLSADFDASSWDNAEFLEGAASAGGSFAWLLEPRNLPLQARYLSRFKKIGKSSGLAIDKSFLQGKTPLFIPANEEITFLIDNETVDFGYPQLQFNKGKGASISMTYAENLFLPKGEKGHRDSLASQRIVGYRDVIRIDSELESVQTYIPTWLRAFRFVQVKVKTGNEPLEIIDFKYFASRTPIATAASFESDNEMYNQIFDICKRTVELTVQDYYLSDAYYETMQYLGDTKVHAPLWQALSGSDVHTRNALTQFHQSRKPDGNLLGAYPLKTTFIFPTYSVIWVDMLWDYYQYSGDKDFLAQFTGGVKHTLDGFQKYIKPNGLVKKPPYSYFVDWYIDADKKNFGTAPGGNEGENSGVVTLHYVHALQSAAKIFQTLGKTHEAIAYASEANRLRTAVVRQCYSDDKGIFATRSGKDYFDMHTNIMAVLTDAIPEAKQSDLLQKILTDENVTPASYYYRYYLFEAIQKTGEVQLFDLAQKPWESMVNNGMTTTLERLESAVKPTRSEVHPWSASPLLFYYQFLVGIQQEEVGWEKVSINPKMGVLKHVKGKYPTPKGIIEFDLYKNEKGSISGEIVLPEGVMATFKSKGVMKKLNSGKNSL